MGYGLAKECWGRGIMTEAMKSVIDIGFEKKGLNRTEVDIMTWNKRSTGLIKRLGFAPDHG